MAKTVTVDSIKRYDSNSDGEEYRTKDGDKFYRVVLEVKGSDKEISLLDFNGWSKKAEEGDKVKLTDFEQDDYGWSAEFDGFAGDQTKSTTGYTDTEKLLYLVENKLLPKVTAIHDELIVSEQESDYPQPDEGQSQDKIDQAFAEYAQQEEDGDLVDEIDF